MRNVVKLPPECSSEVVPFKFDVLSDTVKYAFPLSMPVEKEGL